MQEYQVRVVIELEDLQTKLTKLNLFIHSKEFYNIDLEEQTRLRQQSVIMQQYVQVLIERIRHFR